MKITTNFFTHHKTRKLQKVLGNDGIVSLLKLWSYAETTRPDGTFTNMNETDIELACDGLEGVFVKTLVEIGFLDENDGIFALHDWEDSKEEKAPSPIHGEGVGGEVFGGEDTCLPEALGDAGRVSVLKRWNPEAYKHLQIMGIRTLSKAGYEAWRNWSKAKPREPVNLDKAA